MLLLLLPLFLPLPFLLFFCRCVCYYSLLYFYCFFLNTFWGCPEVIRECRGVAGPSGGSSEAEKELQRQILPPPITWIWSARSRLLEEATFSPFASSNNLDLGGPSFQTGPLIIADLELGVVWRVLATTRHPARSPHSRAHPQDDVS